MKENLKKYLDYIFKSFEGHRVGQGGFFLRKWNNERTKPSFKNALFNTVAILIQNELVILDDTTSGLPFLKLTRTGYDYMQGGDLELGKTDLSKLIDQTVSPDEMYDHLWQFIGKEDEAPFYLKGSEFFYAIAPYIGLSSYSYSEFIQKRNTEGKSNSRITFFRELFMRLAPEQIENFLKDLSRVIISKYQPQFKENSESEDNKLDFIFDAEANNANIANSTIENLKPNHSKTPVIFISYTWETAITPGHKDWVKALAKKLIGEDFDVRLDQFQPYGTEMNHFMRKSVRESDRILLICTPTFKQRSDNLENASGFEASMISNELIKDITSTKLLPIVRIGEPSESMPDYLGNRNALIWHPSDKDEEKLQDLITDLRRAIVIKK